MKKIKVARRPGATLPPGDTNMKVIYGDLLNKELQSEEAEKGRKVKLARPNSIDATHRFGKKSGNR